MSCYLVHVTPEKLADISVQHQVLVTVQPNHTPELREENSKKLEVDVQVVVTRIKLFNFLFLIFKKLNKEK